MTNQTPFAPTINRAEGDVDILVRKRFFSPPAVPSGVFVEVGAARPDYLSVSALYRKLGWQVIAVEPNPAYAELHEALGYEVLQYACGDRDEDDVPFVVADSHGIAYQDGAVSYESFSSLALKDTYAAILPKGVDLGHIKVKLRKLDTILAEHAPNVSNIDIVCVDVEGWELEVLAGLSFARYQPKVLIVENMFYEPRYRRFMRERGYRLWRTVEYNEVYVRSTLLTAGEKIAGALVTLLADLRRRARAALRRLRR